jgi:hypothetical protein
LRIGGVSGERSSQFPVLSSQNSGLQWAVLLPAEGGAVSNFIQVTPFMMVDDLERALTLLYRHPGL